MGSPVDPLHFFEPVTKAGAPPFSRSLREGGAFDRRHNTGARALLLCSWPVFRGCLTISRLVVGEISDSDENPVCDTTGRTG